MIDYTRRATASDVIFDSVGVYSLSELGAIRILGDDSRPWLNGQVTAQLSAGEAQASATYTLMVNLQGRVITDGWVYDRSDDLIFACPRTVIDAVVESLDRYIIMEDVELEPARDLSVITAQGPKALELLTHSDVADEVCFRTRRFGMDDRIPEGVDLVVNSVQHDEVLDRLARAAEALGGSKLDEASWELARIRSGRPKFGLDFGDFTLPQEAGLEHIAVSFQKGCYVGQEAVVMLQHRGKPPKRLLRMNLEVGTEVSPEAPVTTADGEVVGKITSLAMDAAPAALAMALVKRAHIDTPLYVHGVRAGTRTIIGAPPKTDGSSTGGYSA